MDKNKQDPQYQQTMEAITKEVVKFLALGEIKQDLEGKISAVLQGVADLKKNLIQNITDANKVAVASLYGALTNIESSLKGLIQNTEMKALNAVKEVEGNLKRDISRVEKMIPKQVDLEPIEQRIDNLDLLTMNEVEAALPKFGTLFRDGLELLQGEDRLDKSAIKGLDEELKKVEGKIPKIFPGGGGRAGGMQLYDLTSQTTGSLKVFTVPKSRNCYLIGTDFPTILMEGNGFSINTSRTQITLTPDNAPSSGSQLLFVYTSVFNV